MWDVILIVAACVCIGVPCIIIGKRIQSTYQPGSLLHGRLFGGAGWASLAFAAAIVIAAVL